MEREKEGTHAMDRVEQLVPRQGYVIAPIKNVSSYSNERQIQPTKVPKEKPSTVSKVLGSCGVNQPTLYILAQAHVSFLSVYLLLTALSFLFLNYATKH